MLTNYRARLLSALAACLLALISASVPVLSAPKAPTYGLVNLGPLLNEVQPTSFLGPGTPGTGSVSFGLAVTSGQAVGQGDTQVTTYYQGTGGALTPGTIDSYHAFLYTGNGMKKDLGTLPVPSPYPTVLLGNSLQSGANGVNAHDQVVGWSSLVGPTSIIEHAVIWNGSKITDLGAMFNALYPNNSPTLQLATNSYTFGINSSGQAVGYGFDYAQVAGQNPDYHAFLYDSTSNTITDLSAQFYADQPFNQEAALSSGRESEALSINNNGQIAGYVYYFSAPNDPNGQYNGRFPVVYDLNTGAVTVLLSSFGMTDPIFVYGTQQGYGAGYAVINDIGDVTFTGLYTGSQGEVDHAILWKGGKFTDLGSESDPNGNSYANYNTSALSVNKSDVVVGNGLIPTDGHGHFMPGGQQFAYTGLLWKNGVVYDINDITQMPPGWIISDLRSIADGGEIAGIASPPGGQSPVVAILLRPSPAYKIYDLGSTEVYHINSYGQIVGAAGLWTPTTANGAVSTQGFVNIGMDALGINDSGQVTGQHDTGTQDANGSEILDAALWTPSASNGTTGAIADLGEIGSAAPWPVSNTPGVSIFPVGPATQSAGLAVNATGEVAGWSTTKGVVTTGLVYVQVAPGPNTSNITDMDIINGFTDSPGGAIKAVTAPASLIVGETPSEYNGIPGDGILGNNGAIAPPQAWSPGAAAIGARGQVAGWGNTEYFDYFDGNPNDPLPFSYDTFAYYYSHATGGLAIPPLDSTGSVNESSPHPYTMAYGMNATPQVVGESEISTAGPRQHAYLWQPDGIYVDLGALAPGYSYTSGNQSFTGALAPFYADSAAYDINSHGVAVGWSNSDVPDYPNSTGSSSAHAVIWNGNAITDLNGLLPSNSGWLLLDAVGINNKGEIIGMGMLTSGPNQGAQHAFLLVP